MQQVVTSHCLKVQLSWHRFRGDITGIYWRMAAVVVDGW